MFPFYPYLAVEKVEFSRGLSLKTGVEMIGNFWYYSIPAYDQYGFAGYTQTDFGQNLNLYITSSYLSYSNLKVAFSVFYNSIKRNELRVYDLNLYENVSSYGVSLGYKALRFLSLGIGGKVKGEGRLLSFEFLLRDGYRMYGGGEISIGTDKRTEYYLFSSLALMDERFSELKAYLTNSYKTLGFLRYESFITKFLKLKLGAGAIYEENIYKPVFSLGQEMRMGNYVMGIDANVKPSSYKGNGYKVDWNEVLLSIWIKL